MVGYRQGIHNWRILTSGSRVEFSHDVVFNEAIFPGISPVSSADDPALFSLDEDPPVPSISTTPEVDDDEFFEVKEEFPETDSPPKNPQSHPPRNISSSIDAANILTSKRRAHLANKILTTSPFYDTIFALSASANTPLASVPKSYKQAMASPEVAQWTDAVDVELAAMVRLKVWDVVPIPSGANLLGSIWVFHKKYDTDGNLLKFKARLCAQGSAQQEGIDYTETYAPTGRSAALRMVLAYAVNNNLGIHQMDVRNAFLNGTLDEVIHLCCPAGLTIPPGHCLKLNKSIYGLKQAPRVWYRALSEFFATINFSPAPNEPCLFVSQVPGWQCMVHVYVDDMVIIGNDVNRFKKLIKARFLMDDLGPASSLLGMKIPRFKSHITLSQEKHIDKILTEYKFVNCRPVSTPMVPNTRLVAATPAERDHFDALNINYRRAIGSINYVAVATRPDISFAVSQLSQHLENPGINHWRAYNHLLRYISATKSLSVRIGGGDKSFRIYTDDWGNCPELRRSYSGYLVTWGDTILGWKSKKQASVSTSTTEAEYQSLYDGVQEAIWINSIMVSLTGHLVYPIDVFCDNQAAIALSHNPLANQHTKHIDIKYHFI
ncbi:hypothetical protein MJO29_005053 [Puccinia striiformis f. sp. tritici]|nr:hypothetical protein MJO29_005053 [Puccinia striiformis f. sp. tritici]